MRLLLLIGSALSCLLLAALLMSGRSLLRPMATNRRYSHPLAYWTQVGLALAVTVALLILAGTSS